MTWKRRLLLAALAALGLSAALAILILLFGEFGGTQVRILATTFSISGYSLLMLPGALLAERRRARTLALANVAWAAIAFVLVLLVIWVDSGSDSLGRLLGTATAIAFALAQVAAMTVWRRDGDSVALRRVFLAATATVAVVAALVVYALWAEPDSEVFARVVASLAVLDVFLVILQPLLRRLRGGDDAVTVVLEGTREQVEAALARVEGTGVRVRR